MTAKAWQWDIRRSDKEIRQILKNPAHPRFLHYAALLLSRSNLPKEVFGPYLRKEDFCIHWEQIKRCMRKNEWNLDRIHFWQEIYRYLKEDLKVKGVRLRKPPVPLAREDSLRMRIARRIRELRRSKKMTQLEVAKGAGLTQQFVSRIEQGRENISLDTLERLQKFFGEEVLG